MRSRETRVAIAKPLTRRAGNLARKSIERGRIDNLRPRYRDRSIAEKDEHGVPASRVLVDRGSVGMPRVAIVLARQTQRWPAHIENANRSTRLSAQAGGNLRPIV